MATREWIESAALKEKRPVGRGIETRGTHILHGATVRYPDREVLVARMLWREDPDTIQEVAEMLDLAPPPVPERAEEIVGHDVVEVLLRTLRHEGKAAARAFKAGLSEEQRKAAKRELARRRAER